MSVQKKRISKRRTRIRRSHHAISVVQSSTCPSCGNPIRPHYACQHCGKYRGRDVLKLQAKVEKKISAGAAKAKRSKKSEEAEAKPEKTAKAAKTKPASSPAKPAKSEAAEPTKS